MLQFAVADGSGEGDGITDVADAGQIHDAALEAQAEAGMAGRAVLAQIQVEVVILGIHTQLLDTGLLERLHNILNNDFGRITYTDAVALLEKHNDKFEYPVSWGCDLQTEHERYLTEVIFKKPVFVTDYPKEIKAFYMKLNPDGKTVAALDCLVPGIGEIIGGSQREDNYDVLLNRMQEMNLKPEDYDFYLDLRKYGSARHAGFGLGFERCVMYLTGITNIRDVLPFPRTVGNCEL